MEAIFIVLIAALSVFYFILAIKLWNACNNISKTTKLTQTLVYSLTKVDTQNEHSAFGFSKGDKVIATIIYPNKDVERRGTVIYFNTKELTFTVKDADTGLQEDYAPYQLRHDNSTAE